MKLVRPLKNVITRVGCTRFTLNIGELNSIDGLPEVSGDEIRIRICLRNAVDHQSSTRIPSFVQRLVEKRQIAADENNRSQQVRRAHKRVDLMMEKE